MPMLKNVPPHRFNASFAVLLLATALILHGCEAAGPADEPAATGSVTPDREQRARSAPEATVTEAEHGVEHVYATVDGTTLSAFVYHPPTDALRSIESASGASARDAGLPAIVLIHGGGWKSGAPDAEPYRAQFLARRGYVVASVEYRLATTPENRFPAAIHDLKAAVRWLRAHAQRLNIDPNRIAAVGGSAGGHLAALLATSADIAALEGTVGDHDAASSAIQAAVGWGTPFDLVAVANCKPDDWGGSLANFLGGPISTQRATYDLASPAAHLDAGDPPLMFIHSIDERIVFPRVQAAAFAHVRQINPANRVIELPGDEHAFWVTVDGDPRETEFTLRTTADFLDDVMP